MKLIVKKSAIESAAVLLSKVINAKNSLPILGDILCEVKDKQMTMTASDSEVTVTRTIELEEMEGDGRFCVEAARLVSALSQLSEQPVTIIATTESSNVFTLQHDSGETYFPIENAEEFPMPTANEFSTTMMLKGQSIRDALKRSLWATVDDELRPVLNGICLNATDEYIDIVASDGHVLVRNRLYDQGGEGTGKAIIPKKAAKLLSDVLDSGEVKLQLNESMCQVETFPYTITFRLIEGKYPKYDSIIPIDQPICAVVPRVTMLNSIKKILPFTVESSKLLRLSFSNSTLMLTGEDDNFSIGANDKFNIEYPHPNMEIGVNGSRLLTLFNKLPGEESSMWMTDPSRAIVIEPKDQDDDVEITMLTMPMLMND